MFAEFPDKPYDTDLTDSQWAELEKKILPILTPSEGKKMGRSHKYSIRKLCDAVRYRDKVIDNWCYLPYPYFPPITTVSSFKARAKKRGALDFILKV